MADDENQGGEEDLWAAAAEDLEKQREMLRDEAGQEGGGEGGAPAEGGGGAVSTETAPPGEYDRILDIPLQLTVELGEAKMLINDLLQLGQGSVIELTKLVGEPLDVMANGEIVAKGEVVVVNEKFGVRLTEVLSPKERLENLG